MIAQSAPLQTKGHTYAMCIYTFLNYDRPSHGLLLSQRLIASHPQQDDCKSTKKNWDLQESQKDLTNPNKIVDDLLLKQASYTHT